MYYLGNTALLQQPKTAFLCSRRVPALAVLKCYDWAIAQREQGNCVISGFHGTMEKDVLHYLLKGTQPLILALARGMKTRWEPALEQALHAGRLLVITPFPPSVVRTNTRTAQIRNQLMAELADRIVVGYASPGGQLASLLANISKPVERLM